MVKMPAMNVEGKNALVTGGSKGIGLTIAYTLAAYGANVAISGRNKKDGEEAVRILREVGQKVTYIPCDVSDTKQTIEMVAETIETFGSLDILVNNAGFNQRGEVGEIDEETWNKIIDTNLKGYFTTGQAAIKHMKERKSGVIINISSILGAIGIPKMSCYAASKGGVDQLTRVWAHELGPYNIRVNAMAPGFLSKTMSIDWDKEPETKKRVEGSTMLGRLGEMEDIVGPTLFLASDMSSYVTGHVLYVEGGYVAR